MAQQHGGAQSGTGYPEPTDITPIDITPDDAADEADDQPSRWTADGGVGSTVPLTARRPRRTRRIVLGAVLVVGLVGAAALGTAGVRVMQQKDATLTPPAAIAGLTRDDGDGAADTAEYMRTALAAGVEVDDTIAVVYADPADDARGVLFFGGTALFFTPERELDDALGLLGDAGEGDAAMREVPAGDLGGVMKCGTVTVPEGGMSVCGWADHGSVAVAMFPKRTLSDAEPLMRQLRDATQSRS